MLSQRYLDKKASRDFIKELHPMFGDLEVHGVSISYCKYISKFFTNERFLFNSYFFLFFYIIQLKLGFKAAILKNLWVQLYI